MGYSVELPDCVLADVSALWEVLLKQSVSVFVRAPLPRAFWTAEVNIQAGIDVQVGVLRHVCPLLPGQ